MDFSISFRNIEKSVVNVISLDAQQEVISSGSGTIIGSEVISSGSGTIIGSGDLVLTCAHCIAPNTSTAVRFSGQNTVKYGKVIFFDEQVDVALVQFQSPIGPSAPIRTSSSILVGHEVFVVGFPNNISQVTTLSGNIAGFEPNEKFEHTRIDVSVNHGNSGGPLFNSKGELIGVVNAKHGSLSDFLQQVQNATPGARMSIGGINPVQAIQQLIGEMQKNLNLGIGYAIPTDYIGSLNALVSSAIRK